MYYMQCGNQVEQDVKFCIHCGHCQCSNQNLIDKKSSHLKNKKT